MNLKEELGNRFHGEVAEDEITLNKYSRDASVFVVKPQAVVFPCDAEDVKVLVNHAREYANKGVSLTARSAGTCMSGGPLTESIVVEFMHHFNRVKSVEKTSSEEGCAVVQPGVYYRDFEKKTLEHNLVLQSYPASREICAVGGMVANSGGGENSLMYGKTEKFVKKLKVVLHDGNEYVFEPLSKAELDRKMAQQDFEGDLYRRVFELVDSNYELLQKAKPKVSKNSTGYALWDVWNRETQIFDMTKLFVGSQGTLGLITEITLRLVRPKKYATLLVIFLKDLKPLPEIIERVLEKRPESFESYDDETLKLALRFLPGFVKLLKGNIVSLAWQFLPEVKMMLTGGMPKLVMFAEFTEDSEEGARAQAQAALDSLKDLRLNMRLTKSQKEVDKYFTVRRESFSLLRHHVSGKRTVPFIDDIVVAPQYLPEFFPRLWKLLEPYKKYMTHTIAGHVGDGNFHVIPLMNMEDAKVREVIPELMPKVHDLVFEYHGSFSGEHNDGLIRSPYLKDMYGEEVYSLFERVKNIFDPDNIFNPGKKVGASLEYSLAHMATTNKTT